MIKRIISFMLCVMLAVSMCTVAFAVESDEPLIQVAENKVVVEGNNPVGNIVAEAINEQGLTNGMGRNVITDIIISENTATIEYSSEQDCTIIVALYDEWSNKMVTSVNVKATADNEMVTGEFPSDEMPSYFVVKGFMVDENNNPLSQKYESSYYTRDIQELVEKTPDDYEEERVVLLDENDNSDFAVYSYDTVVLHNQPGYNVPVFVDEEIGKYVFSNPSEELLNLQEDQLFSYNRGNCDIILGTAKVVEINDDNTVTVWATNDNLSQAFELIKLGGSSTEQQAVAQTYENIRASKKKAPASTGAAKTKIDDEGYLVYEVATDEKSDTKGTVGFGIKGEAEAIISPAEVSISFELLYKAYLNLESSVSYESEIKIYDFKFNVATGITVGIYPVIEVSGEVKSEATLRIDGSLGAKYDLDKGFTNISVPPEFTEESFKVEGSLAVGIGLVPHLDFVDDDIATIEVECVGSLRAFISYEGDNREADGKIKHRCLACFKVGIEAVGTVDASVTLFGAKKPNWEENLIEFTSPMDSFDYSFDLRELNEECPNYTYETTITITKDGKPYKCSGDIYGSRSYHYSSEGTYYPFATDENGVGTVTLLKGDYQLCIGEFKRNFYTIEETLDMKFDLSGEPDVTMNTMPTSPKPTQTTPVVTEPPGPAVIAQGSCGDSARWEIYDDGNMYIIGKGATDDYNYGEAPFFGYRNFIKNVSVEDGISYLGEYFFAGLSKTDSFEIPNSVQSLGDSVFKNCTSFVSLNLPDGIEEIPNYAFSFCSNLKEINIPQTVKVIGDYAFEYCITVTDLVISESITYVGYGAFSNCTALTSVDYRAVSNTKMGSDMSPVFFGCSALTSIKLNEGVEKIPAYSFYGCREFTSVTIPASVKTIGDMAFGRCGVLETVNFNAKNCTYAGQYSAPIFANCQAVNNILIGEGVTNIPACAFFDTDIKTISIPDTVTVLGDYAFYSCSELTEIEVPSSVTKVGIGTFGKCSKMTGAKLPLTISKIPEKLFYKCSSLSFLSSVEYITSVGDYAFSDCESLTYLTFTEALTEIGVGAFQNCTQIKTITLPENISVISELAFKNCKAMKYASISDNATKIERKAFYGCKTLKKVTIPEKVTFIGEDAFTNCEALETLVFNATNCSDIQEDGRIFGGCNLLNTVDFGDSVKRIPAYLLRSCTGITQVSISDSVTEIGTMAFAGCIGLTEMTVPNSVTDLGVGVFSGCTSLENVILPESIEVYPREIFKNCQSLKNINITESVTAIGNMAFYGCKSLTKINVPMSVKVIGESAFENCSNVTDLTISLGVWNVRNRSFAGCKKIESISLPTTAKIVGDSAFEGCSDAKEILLSNGVKDIGDKAFADCTGITEINIPANLNITTTIGAGAFSGCTNATVLNYNAEYSEYTGGRELPPFANCTKLKEINIGENVTYLPNYIFADCSLITEITIPEKCIEGGKYAFVGCDSLKTVYYNAFSELSDDYIDNGLMYGSISFECCPNLTTAYVKYGIHAKVFSDCKKLQNVYFSEDAEFIGYYGLSGTKLKNLTLPKNMKLLMRSSLYNCEIENFTINAETCVGLNNGYFLPEQLVFSNLKIGNLTIGSDVNIYTTDSGPTLIFGSDYYFAFDRASCQIGSVTVGDNVDFGIFNGIPIDEINLYSGTKNYIKDGNGIYNGDKTELIRCENGPKHITVSEGVVAIGDDAFANLTYKTFDLPDTLKTIGACAFENLSLEEITLPDSVETIGSYAFRNTKLKAIALPDSLAEIGDGLFADLPLENVTFNNSLVTIGVSAFKNTKITNGTLPKSLKSIGISAFENTNIETLVLPDGLETIGECAFKGTKVNNAELPDSITQVGNEAFYGLTLENATIPSGASIGEYTFADCIIENMKIADGAKLVGYLAFVNSEVRTFEFVDNITKIEDAIEGIAVDTIKYNGTEYVLQNNVLYNLAKTKIIKCGTMVSSLEIPETVRELSMYAFTNNKLEILVLPDSVYEFNLAFENCKVKKLTFGDTFAERVTSVGYAGDLRADTLDYVGTSGDYSVEDNVLYDDYAYYNYELIFTGCDMDEVVIRSDIKDVVSQYNYSNMRTLTIHSSVEYICDSFQNCKNLTTINYNARDCWIPFQKDDFEGCDAITMINIGASVSYDSTYWFKMVTESPSLKEVNFSGRADESLIDLAQEIRNDIPYEQEVTFYYPADSYTWTNEIVSECSKYVTMKSYTPTEIATTSVNKSVASTGTDSEDFNDEEVVESYDNLLPYEEYIFAVVKDAEIEDVLSADNLLYIDQLTADSEGRIYPGEYSLREYWATPQVVIYGAEKYDISKAEITVSKLTYNGKEQTPVYQVNYNGVPLEENTDFTVSGDLSVKEAGKYHITFNGINRFEGQKEVSFTVDVVSLIGDINLDGEIDVKDVTLLQKYLVQIAELSDESLKLADADGNNRINIMDATYIQWYLAQVEKEKSLVGTNI